MSYGVIVNKLFTPVGILPLLTLKKPISNIPIKTKALWDTGATMTCIKPELFKRLQLRPYDEAGLTTIAGIGGKIEAALTLINLFLTSNFVIEPCRVHVIDFPGNADILIGWISSEWATLPFAIPIIKHRSLSLYRRFPTE